MIKRVLVIVAVFVALLAGYRCFAAALPITTPPPLWNAPKLLAPPNIDGNVEEAEWKSASSFTGYQLYPQFGRGFSPHQTQTFVGWDEDYLYIAFRSPHLYRDPVLVNVRGRDAPAYTDEAYEIILWQPNGIDTYAFIVGLASLFDEKSGKASWNSAGIKCETSQHDNLFDAELAIPWQDIDVSPVPGMEIKIVFAHDIFGKTKLMTNWHYSSDTYHAKNLAGTLLLTNDKPAVRMLDWGPVLSGFAKPELEFVNTAAASSKVDYTIYMGSALDQPVESFMANESFELPAGNVHKVAPNWQVLTTDLKIARLTASAEGVKLVDFAFPFEFSPEIKLKITPYPSQHRLSIAVDAAPTRVVGAVQSVKMTFLQSSKTLAEETKRVDSNTHAEFNLDISKIAIGDYSIKAEAFDPNGKQLKESIVPWHKPDDKPDWMVHPIANERRVPKGFSPVILTKENPGTFHVQMWGRTYTFSNSIFPVQLKSQSRKMLAEPVRLVGSVNGKEFNISAAEVKIAEQTPDMTVLLTYAKAEDFSVRAETSIEFDGMLYTKFDITPLRKNVDIDSLRVEFPFEKEASTLMHWNNCTISGAGWAGATPDKWGSPFHPVLWLGDEYIGMCWFCETINGWSNGVENHQLLINKNDNSTVFAMNIVDKPRELNEAMRVEFGFTVTPAKPMPKNWLMGMNGWMEPWWDESNQFLHEAVPWEIWHKWVDETHARGSKTYKYIQTNFLSFYGDMTPEEAKAKNRPGNNYMDTPEKKYWGVEWEVWPQAGMGGKANAFCKKTPWQDLIVAGLQERLVKGRVDGIYFDCSQPRFCENTLHGCTGGYDILAERNIRRRLYNLFDELGKESLIFEHNSDNMLGPVMNFSTYHYDGEQYSSGVNDYREKLTLERMRAFSIGTNWGHVPEFMSFANDNKALNSLMGIWTLHMPWHSVTSKWNELCEDARRVDRDFGFDTNSKRLGYWENQNIVRGQGEKLKSTIYYKPGAVFIVVSNLSDNEVDAQLQLDLKKIHINTSRLVINDFLHNQPSPPVLADGVFKCKILPNSCVMSSLKVK